MRSGGGTKSGEPCLATRSTKAMMALLGAVSFHDGSGSWAKPGAVHDTAITATAAMRAQFSQRVFMGETSMRSRWMLNEPPTGRSVQPLRALLGDCVPGLRNLRLYG